ncbi:MAG: DUF2817 domain-containing protein [Flavobacteriaceae bacterium TMED120]|nr:MAG: DUF2817 domain-containing protein [Flavobacteriaceae bacterium TMED120]HCQ24506.1 peptidase M14 [Flavobacteriaceae bacterium]|tara:strand:- start:64050 stop:65123 length:1074 start_codon:yes stop_codon:yes gene_type:complete
MQRYLSPIDIDNFVNDNRAIFPFTVMGHSVEKRPIHSLQLGSGPNRVLLWSQMHGNESSTTRALLILLSRIRQGEEFPFLKELSLYIIPQLNPDGAIRFQRFNANGVDLNRDALAMTQPESQFLKQVYSTFKPHFALNLHGQCTIYAAGYNGKPATLSFLAPAADSNRSCPPQRLKAMQLIAAMLEDLEGLEGGIGRYDDAFNENCVGDSFMSMGTPTVLFEAGHYPEDYERNTTTEWTYKALLACFNHIAAKDFESKKIDDYELIPENHKDFVDLLIRGVTIDYKGQLFKNQQLAILYEEELREGRLTLIPTFHSFGSNLSLRAHEYPDLPTLKTPISIEFHKGNEVDFLDNITIQ